MRELLLIFISIFCFCLMAFFSRELIIIQHSVVNGKVDSYGKIYACQEWNYNGKNKFTKEK